MSETCIRLFRHLILGLLVGAACLAVILTFREPRPRLSNVIGRVDQNTSEHLESSQVIMEPSHMEALLEKLAIKQIEEAADIARSIDSPWTVDEWASAQLRLIDRIHDPSLCDEVAKELKELKETAYLPGSVAHERIQPVDRLIQYAFMVWTRDDSDKALTLEREWVEPPTDYWAPFEAILMAWCETDPDAALDAMLQRIDREPLRSRRLPRAGLLDRYHENPSILFEKTRTIRHECLISTIASHALHWRSKDPELIEAWFQDHPDHPVATDISFQSAMKKGAN